MTLLHQLLPASVKMSAKCEMNPEANKEMSCVVYKDNNFRDY